LETPFFLFSELLFVPIFAIFFGVALGIDQNDLQTLFFFVTSSPPFGPLKTLLAFGWLMKTLMSSLSVPPHSFSVSSCRRIEVDKSFFDLSLGPPYSSTRSLGI